MARKTWTGGAANWTQASGWGGTIPTSADDALIPTGTVAVTTDVGTVKTVTVGTGFPGGPSRLSILGGTLAVSGTFLNWDRVQVGDAFQTGVLAAGAIDNRGELDLGGGAQSGSSLGGAAHVTTNRLLNANGLIAIYGGEPDAPSPQAFVLDVKAPAGDGTTGRLDGSYTLDGDALLQFASGQISNIQGSIVLTGPMARIADSSAPSSNSALTALRTIGRTGPTYADRGGSLDLSQGSAVTTTGPLEVDGILGIDEATRYEAGGSQFTVNGAVRLRGSIGMGAESLYNDARFTASALTIDEGGVLNAKGGQSRDDGSARVAVRGALVNRGIFGLGAHGTAVVGSYTQLNGDTEFGVNGTDAGQFATLAVKGAVTLGGGTGYISTQMYGQPLAAGQSYTLVRFAPGRLTGQFDQLEYYSAAVRQGLPDTGSGTVVPIADNSIFLSDGTHPQRALDAGLVYNDSAGTVTLKVVATPSTTIDTLTGRGSFGAAAGWSAGTPDFYTDAVVAAGATSTIGQDVTINSLAMEAGATVTSAAGTDLHVGATLAVASGAMLRVGGAAVVSSAVTCDGSVTLARNASVDLRGNVGGNGRIALGAGSTLELRAMDTTTVDFGGHAATLKLDHTYLFEGTLAHLSVGASLDLLDTVVASATVSGDTLTVHKADTSTATFKLSDRQVGTRFVVQDDGAGGSKLVLQSAPHSLKLPLFSGAGPAGGVSAPSGTAAYANTEAASATFDGRDLFVTKPASVLT